MTKERSESCKRYLTKVWTSSMAGELQDCPMI